MKLVATSSLMSKARRKIPHAPSPNNTNPTFKMIHAHQPAADAAKPVCPVPPTPTVLRAHEDDVLTEGFISVNEEVVIRLKWGQTEYKGRLVSIDSYMNIQLSGAEEWIDQEMTSSLGQVLIRCNNVLWIQGANQNNGNGDTKMEG
ncbi:putative small nuclear ribonucleoprotein [Lachnellula occidentalis]|uniref:Sm protein F n=1 Tax=Lachnellula occidentalis TaxID=215460 RepID=A0A8H8S7R3_9HELO|nr:putative small nuclear ribonucleoprotein [Lachnellula occidentalis]